jgi:hypothetical protein
VGVECCMGKSLGPTIHINLSVFSSPKKKTPPPLAEGCLWREIR